MTIFDTTNTFTPDTRQGLPSNPNPGRLRSSQKGSILSLASTTRRPLPVLSAPTHDVPEVGPSPPPAQETPWFHPDPVFNPTPTPSSISLNSLLLCLQPRWWHLTRNSDLQHPSPSSGTIPTIPESPSDQSRDVRPRNDRMTNRGGWSSEKKDGGKPESPPTEKSSTRYNICVLCETQTR